MWGNVPPLDAVIDTGFQGADLLLPQAVIRQLRLSPSGDVQTILGNEQTVKFTYYYAQVVWHGSLKQVIVLESENESLVSANLLAGSRITIDMTPGGIVTIDELPTS